jgi:hypothetical protein
MKNNTFDLEAVENGLKRMADDRIQRRINRYAEMKGYYAILKHLHPRFSKRQIIDIMSELSTYGRETIRKAIGQ